MTTPITGETWGDEVDGVRNYILREAEMPFSALKPKLEAARSELLNAVEGMSEKQAEFRLGEGDSEEDWGVAEALRHIASVEAIMAQRIWALGTASPVELKATYPGYHEDVQTRRLPELMAALAVSGQALLSAIDEIEGKERLDTFDRHRRFGELNCRGWVVMHTLHQRDHTYQIHKIKQMSGFPER